MVDAEHGILAVEEGHGIEEDRLDPLVVMEVLTDDATVVLVASIIDRSKYAYK